MSLCMGKLFKVSQGLSDVNIVAVQSVSGAIRWSTFL